MSETTSPCINVCVMHPGEGVCIGCFRSMDEITAWAEMDLAARQAVMRDLPARKDAIIARRRAQSGRGRD